MYEYVHYAHVESLRHHLTFCEMKSWRYIFITWWCDVWGQILLAMRKRMFTSHVKELMVSRARGHSVSTSWGWWRLVVRWSFLEAFRWHGFLALHPGWKLCHGGQWKVGDPWSKWDRRVDVYITVYIDKFQSHRRFSAIRRSWQTFFFLGTRLAVPAKVRSSKLLFDGMGCSRHILLSDIIWPAR